MDNKSKTLRKIEEDIEVCLLLFDYGNCIYELFGISREMVPEQNKMWKWLLQMQKAVSLAKKSGSLTQYVDAEGTVHNLRIELNLKILLDQLRSAKKFGKQNKQRWKSGPIKIFCSLDELRRIVFKVRDEEVVSFTKAEFDQRFDISGCDPYWRWVPAYAKVFLGGGLGFSFPEWDMFYAMCYFHDEAIRTSRELDNHRQKAANGDNCDEDAYHKLHILHFVYVRQAVVNACMFVEAFVNGVAHAYLCKPNPDKPLLYDKRLYLQERRLDKKKGEERTKYVNIKEKLCEWVKLMSPNDKTFDKNAKPYKSFEEIVAYRDSIVHISETKIEDYHGINLDVVKKAVDAALGMVKAICRYISPDPQVIAYPQWFTDRQTDGLFHLSSRINLDSLS